VKLATIAVKAFAILQQRHEKIHLYRNKVIVLVLISIISNIQTHEFYKENLYSIILVKVQLFNQGAVIKLQYIIIEITCAHSTYK